MPQSLDIFTFLKNSRHHGVIVDVRSPSEFTQGHIPGAYNVPLFDDEERKIVGTLYKQSGREEAILKGLEIVGPKLAEICKTVKSMANGKEVFVHCWRGGMRSGSVSWLLETAGLKTYILKKGYKAFRNALPEIFNAPLKIKILSGRTGSGKTRVLHELHKLNTQVIDLEAYARHKGSSFGAIGELPSNSQEQFENELAMSIHFMDNSKQIILEDEGRLIGKKVIPEGLWLQMRAAPVLYIQIPFEKRSAYLVQEYGKFSKQELHDSIVRITKRLGPEQTKNALLALENNDLETTCNICLNYYDKSYDHAYNARDKTEVKDFQFEATDPEYIAKELIPHL